MQVDAIFSRSRIALSGNELTLEPQIQTKFTPPSGQDRENAPYDFSDPLEVQITKSVSSSLRNFRIDEDGDDSEAYIDCLLLHSPLPTLAETLAAWKILETYVPHKIRNLGLSNVDINACRAVSQNPDVKHRPAVVQNRFYPATRFDADLRRLAMGRGAVYESFWTLTGNPQLLRSAAVQGLAKETGVSKEVALYSLVMASDMAVLNGTTNEARMAEDLRDVERVRNWTFVYVDKWKDILAEFKELTEGTG